MPRRYRFTAPFVLTAALAPGCTKDSPKSPPEQAPPPKVETTWAPDPMRPNILVPTPRSLDGDHDKITLEDELWCSVEVDNPPGPSRVPCPAELMPRLADGVQLTLRDAEGCWLDTIQVACPPQAAVIARSWAPGDRDPRLLVPTPRSIDHASASIRLEDDLTCERHVKVQCDQGQPCNPPAPKQVPCPPELMPRLADGVEPTRRDAAGCWLDSIEVGCPPGTAVRWAPDPKHPDLLVPTPRSLDDAAGSIVLEDDLTCMRHVDVQCDPGDKCNPPPPTQVPCPPELAPRPVPAADAPLVFLRDGACHTLDDRVVPCPASGPTLQLPPWRKGDIVVHEWELTCWNDPEDDGCAPDVDCNPPPPQKIACPPDMLAELINGAKPTRTVAGHCFHGDFEVKCP